MDFIPGKGVSASNYGNGELNIINQYGKLNPELLEIFNSTVIKDKDVEDSIYSDEIDEKNPDLTDYIKNVVKNPGFYEYNEKVYIRFLNGNVYKLN